MPEIYSHIGRVSPLARATEAVIVRLQDMGFDAEGDNIFHFRAEISNDLLDSHFTRMNAKTLANYVADANRGVAFLRSHNWRELPVGYSLSAMLDTVSASLAGDDGIISTATKQRVIADFYSIRGLEETDGMIKRIETGLVRDVSVGFHGGRMVCDICSQELFDCRHFPGIKFKEKVDGKDIVRMSTFTIDDAGLSEVSGVYDGSTPDAMVLKAERAAKAGELTPEQIQAIENTYRVRLPTRSSFAVAKLTGEKKMDLANVRTVLAVQTDEEVEAAVSALSQRAKALETQAEEGRQYRKDLVEQALAEGVRAQGNEFNRSLYEETLRTAPLTVVKQMRDDWKKVADTKLPAGRHSTDGAETQAKKEKVQLRPAGAYQ